MVRPTLGSHSLLLNYMAGSTEAAPQLRAGEARPENMGDMSRVCAHWHPALVPNISPYSHQHLDLDPSS